MLVVLFFGGLGWVMEKLEWPRPPVLLGLVLGPLAENRLFLSTDNYGAAWLGRPGVLIILAITLFGIIYPILKNKREEKEKLPSRAETESALEAPRHEGLRFNTKFFFTFIIAILVSFAIFQIGHFCFLALLFSWVFRFQSHI